VELLSISELLAVMANGNYEPRAMITSSSWTEEIREVSMKIWWHLIWNVK
jgi:hypothetical protein